MTLLHRMSAKAPCKMPNALILTPRRGLDHLLTSYLMYSNSDCCRSLHPPHIEVLRTIASFGNGISISCTPRWSGPQFSYGKPS